MPKQVLSLIRNITQKQQHSTLILKLIAQHNNNKGQITVVPWNIVRNYENNRQHYIMSLRGKQF